MCGRIGQEWSPYVLNILMCIALSGQTVGLAKKEDSEKIENFENLVKFGESHETV